MDPIEYQETMATIRHYSNLRFALMTVFVTATAGLFALIFMTPAGNHGGFLTFLFKALALLLTALFWRLEVHLASYIFFLGQYIRKWEPSHYLVLPDHGKQFISKLICAFYGALGVFWLIAMFLYGPRENEAKTQLDVIEMPSLATRLLSLLDTSLS